jgi:SMP-30/Gluconolactonase/LRE-like region
MTMKLSVAAVLLGLAGSVLAQSMDCHLAAKGGISQERQKTFQSLRSNSALDQAAIQFNLALDYAQAGNASKALSVLEEALLQTPWLDPSTEEAFKPLYSCREFQDLVSRVQRKYPPVAASHVVRTVPEKDLIPEGLASDPGDGTLYLSSIYHRKIVKITPQGMISDFVSEAQDGLLGVLGLKVDARDHSVWAASERGGQAALFHFDGNGKTLAKYAPEEKGKHLLNDLVITMQGDVFVTDSEYKSVYKLPHGASRLVRLDLQGRLYPNGIALSADGKSLYVAHGFGIVVMSLNGNEIHELAAPKDVSLAQVDGLYWRKGSLIAIQNGFGANRIVELRLAADGRSVSSGRLLEFRSSNLELPTTGTIYKNDFYYIVNTQADHENNGRLTREETLQPVKIAVLPLR